MIYLLSLVAFLISLLFAMVMIPWILTIAHQLFLYDFPDERKKHQNPVPRIGGMSFFYCILFTMFAMFFISYLFNEPVEQYTLINCFFLSALLILHTGGLRDDLIGIRYRYKFFIQIAAALLIVSSGLYINHLYGFLSIEALPVWIGAPFTVLAIVFIINAMNLIDGIDGLSSGISIFALGIFGILFMQLNEWYYTILAFSTLGVLCVFFCYNVFGSVSKKKKLFMGDSGSMMLGLILAFLAIKYMQHDPNVAKPVDNPLVIAVSPFLIPILDVLRIILSRIKNSKHLFKADRSHIHHKLINMGFSDLMALVILLFITNAFYYLNFCLSHYISTSSIFLVDVVIWTSGNMYLSRLIRKRRNEGKMLIKMDG